MGSDLRGSPAPALVARSVCHLLRDRAARTPDWEFLRFEGQRVSFGEAERSSARMAGALAGLGLAREDRVAIMLPNGFLFPLAWLAVARLGAVIVPCNTAYQESDLSYILQDSGARLIITDPERAGLVRRVQPSCPALERVVVSGGAGVPDRCLSFDALVAAASADGPLADLRPSDLVTLQYTSGTTGFPKGCMLTHEYWLRLGGNAAAEAGIRDGGGDVNLVMTPWFYMDATWNMVTCLIAGIPLVLLSRFSASNFWRSVHDNDVTFFYCLGTIPLVLLKQPEDAELEAGHRVRAVICSAIPPELHAAIEARFGCLWREAYSTTETGPVSLLVPLAEAGSVGTGAMGRPAPGCEARVVDPSGAELGVGRVGELVMRGPGMMLGYWNNAEATASWRRDGWARTGDLVFRDDGGYYHMVGRLKEMIRRGGENISAAEVEAVLCQHPAVRMAACVPVPDEIRGEEVKAFLQLQPGETRDSAPPDAVLAFCRAKLAAFKVPRFISYLDEFPLTPSQRIEKHRLSREREGAYDAVTRTWS